MMRLVSTEGMRAHGYFNAAIMHGLEAMSYVPFCCGGCWAFYGV